MGGTDYSSTEKILDFDVPCSHLCAKESTGVDVSSSKEGLREDNIKGTHNLRSMICLASQSGKDLIVIRLPKNFDIDTLARWSVSPLRKEDGLIGDEGGNCQDRP